ncbi:MAG: hypothetical protein ACRENA_17315, partial [Vulcanimicrobiaceae bacterium]
IGPDNNIWMVENNSRPGGVGYPQYVAVAAIHSSVVNPVNGSTISPGAGVFAEYTLQSTSGLRGNYTAPLHGIVSMGGFIWVIDKDGMLWRIDPTTGGVNPNLAAGYLPGGTVTQASPLTDPGNTTFIYGPAGSRQAILYSMIAVLGNTLYVGNDSLDSIDAVSLDTSASPSAGLCTTAGPPPCIGTFQDLLTGTLPNQSQGGGTDGTSLYLVNGNTDQVYKFTPPSTLATSQSAYSSVHGTIGVSSDSWLWTLTSTGVQALQGMSSTSGPITPATVTSCSSAKGVERAATAWLAGPDGTWLFTPNDSSGSSTTPAVLCAVVY